jgi:hypothetical protein
LNNLIFVHVDFENVFFLLFFNSWFFSGKQQRKTWWKARGKGERVPPSPHQNIPKAPKIYSFKFNATLHQLGDGKMYADSVMVYQVSLWTRKLCMNDNLPVSRGL